METESIWEFVSISVIQLHKHTSSHSISLGTVSYSAHPHIGWHICKSSIYGCHFNCDTQIQILPFSIFKTSFHILFPLTPKKIKNTPPMLQVWASGLGQKPALSHIFAESHGIKQHEAYSRKWSKQKSNLPLWINIILPSEAHPSKITCLLNAAAWHTYVRAHA